MDNERTRTAGLASGTGTAELDTEHREHHENRDPLTGEGGAHPVGTGVGAASGGTVGAMVGGAVAGPVGALIGAAVGGLAGGLAGKGVAESINPSEEESFWRENHGNRNYSQGRSYDELRPAYQYGWEARGRYQDRTWDEAETDLRSGWDQSRGSSTLAWDDARHASRDAWDRVGNRTSPGSSAGSGDDNRTLGLGNAGQIIGGSVATTSSTGGMVGNDMGRMFDSGSSNLGGGDTSALSSGSRFDTTEDTYWRQNFASRPYASGQSYDDYRPAYQYGYDAASRYRGRRFEDVEPELSRGWDQAGTGGASLTWAHVKNAVRDAWDRVERAMPGDADRDGR